MIIYEKHVIHVDIQAISILCNKFLYKAKNTNDDNINKVFTIRYSLVKASKRIYGAEKKGINMM